MCAAGTLAPGRCWSRCCDIRSIRWTFNHVQRMSILHPCTPHTGLLSPCDAQTVYTALSEAEHGVGRVQARCTGGG